jgi:NodT family efflux transporter outer membrane factor (OMF) lipoprotein
VKQFFLHTQWLLALTILLITGCTSFHSQMDHYNVQRNEELQQIPAWQNAAAAQSLTHLDDLINVPHLKSLINEALSANPGLQQTELTLKILRQQRLQSRAPRLPQLEAGYSGEKSEDNSASYNGSLTVSWQVDLWGKLADSEAAARMDVAEQMALLAAARQTLVAEVMSSWLELTAQQQAIGIEQQRLAVLEKNATFIQSRYRSGLSTLQDLDSARTSAASSRATLEEYHESLSQMERALATLLGRSQVIDTAAPASYPQVILPLAELPAQTLALRPDLQAAYLAIEAADLRRQVAYKDLLPSINLQAMLEDVADHPASALLTDPVWSLLGQLTALLYQGGELRAAAEITALQQAQSYQAYRETLLTAVNEIGDAVSLESSLQRQQQHVETALEHAVKTLDHYQTRYRQGLATILELLEVQQQTYDLKAQLNTLTYQRLANRITLGLALGLGVAS